VHISDTAQGIARRGTGRGFTYIMDGEKVTDAATLARIRTLAIPPAWTDVWICPRANGHLQATGRDARGRKQYLYHPAFRAHREEQKYDRLLDFACALPKLRRTIRRHMARAGLPREKVLATIVHLLESTLIRVGNTDYAKTNGSYGLTTLRDGHVNITGSALRFHFKGKSGKTWKLQITNRRVAKIVKACQDLPGQQLFQYYDEAGVIREVTSTDVNNYLREIAGREVTAKDFRTWAGSVLALASLTGCGAAKSEAEAKRNIRATIGAVSAILGNTVAICRKCYVHPRILETYMAGLRPRGRPARGFEGLHPDEKAVVTLLRTRAPGH
jgi:DNA topoisomerase I